MIAWAKNDWRRCEAALDASFPFRFSSSDEIAVNSSLMFVLNLAATWYLVGLIWMVQVVHYFLFDKVGVAEFTAYEADHNRLITPIVAVPMLVELVTAAALVFVPPPGIPRSVAIVGLVAIGLIWLSTAVLQVPYHGRLLQGFDADAYRGLVTTNWIRTVLWSVRGIGVGYFAWRLISR